MYKRQDYKDLPATIAFRKVYDYEGGSWTDAGDGIYTTDTFAYHVSLACNHCAMPACMAKCPSGAIEKDGKTGLVHIDQEDVYKRQVQEQQPDHGPRQQRREPQVRRRVPGRCV